MIAVSWVGHELDPLVVDVEVGRLRQFAKAVGETRPEYVDVAAAQAVGWPSLPVPPTFLFGLEMEQPDPWGFLIPMRVDLARVLHGEQEFDYHHQAWAGDELTFQVRIAGIDRKRSGAMELITKKTVVTNQDGEHIADLQSVLVVRTGPQ